MKMFISLCCCTLLSASFLFATSLVPPPHPSKFNSLSSEEEREHFELLFNGIELSPDTWQSAIEGYPVEEGVIVCRKGGNLLTKKEYKDFVFRFEFMLPKGGNNGVGIRAESPKKDAAYHGMEIQILDNNDPQYAKLLPSQYHGSIYKVVAAKRNPKKNDYLKPDGEWNVEEISAVGSKIKVVLNGETIVDADIANINVAGHPGLHREKGFIGFLGHGSPVKFRNIKIKEVKPE